MGWFSDFVSDPIGTVGDTVQTTWDTVTTPDALKIGAVAAGGYYGLEALGAAESGTALTASETAGAEALSGIDLGGAGASPASWTNATTATMAGDAVSGWTAGQIASTVTSGLNLATSGVKLATLGKAMQANTATANGLTGALANSPIETPSGLITSTPQGPVTAATTVAGTTPSTGMDKQTIMVIGFAVVVLYFLHKSGNLK